MPPQELPEGISNFGKPPEINRPRFDENGTAPAYDEPHHNNTSSPVSPIYKPAGNPSESIGLPEKTQDFEAQESEKTRWLGDNSDSDTDRSDN